MYNEKTNHEKYKEQLLSIPENKAMYLLSREKIKLEMMLETLKEQIVQEKSRKTILSQITRISNKVAQFTL